MHNHTFLKKSKNTSRCIEKGGGMRVCLWVMVIGFILGLPGILEAAMESVGRGQPYSNISDVVSRFNPDDIVKSNNIFFHIVCKI